MLLVIDVGNTNIVAGVFDGKKIASHWRFSTDRSKTADEYGILLRSMFNYTKMPMDEVKDIIISSVVPPLIVPLCHMCERYFELVPMVVGPGIKTGISLRYDNPREVGADRIVNAVAAFEKYAAKGKPMIIVDLYLGGAIAPGIGISAEALFQRTAKLPRVELIKPATVICKNTVNAIQAGILVGYVGQMNEIVCKMKEELGGEAIVIATGGFATTMAAESDVIDYVEPFLTLEGLRILHEKNEK